LYAIQDLVSCPLSSISLVWSHAAGLHVDYLIGLNTIARLERSKRPRWLSMYVIWRQAFALYANQDLASCPLSSISLVWSHAAGLHVDYLIASVEMRNDCPSREVEEATKAINVCDVIWRQAFALYAIQDLVSCPWSSISLVWSHAAGLHVDYLS